MDLADHSRKVAQCLPIRPRPRHNDAPSTGWFARSVVVLVTKTLPIRRRFRVESFAIRVTLRGSSLSRRQTLGEAPAWCGRPRTGPRTGQIRDRTGEVAIGPVR
jgi:hypothetical protein